MDYESNSNPIKEVPNLSVRNTCYALPSHEDSKLSNCLPPRPSARANNSFERGLKSRESPDTGSAARHCQLTLAQLKEDIANEVDLRKKTLEVFRLTMESIIEKTLDELMNSIEDFKKTIMEEALEERDMVFSRIIEISSELEREFTFAEPEFSALEKLKETGDSTELLPNSSLRESLDIKRCKINSIAQSTKQLEGRAEDFINDCERKSNNIKDYKKYSRMRATEMQVKKGEEIKQLDLIVSMKLHELTEALSRNNQVRKEMESLKSEKDELVDSIHILKSHQAQLEYDIQQMKATIKELEKSKESLDNYVQNKKAEIASLDIIIKSKEELRETMREKLAAPSFVQASVVGDYQEVLLLNQSNVIFIYDQRETKLHIYNFNLKRVTSLSARSYGILSNHGSVQVRDSFYVTGGFSTSSFSFSKAALVISLSDLDKIEMEQKADMLLGKSQHKLVLLSMNEIFSLGGKAKDQKFLSYCEKYDIRENEWKEAPPLNEAKLDISAIAVDAVYIYTFGGQKGVPSQLIEFLKADVEGGDWVILKLEGHDNWVPKEGIGCFQLEESKVMIFGGIDAKAGCVSDTWIFDIDTMKFVKQAGKLEKKEWFATRTAIRLHDGRICAAGFFAGDIHVFYSNKTWSIIKLKQWKK